MSAEGARPIPVESPFQIPIFRAIWLASLVSNIGTWMQNVAAAWMMTTLSASPLVVALVQTATSLPFFFLALPAGALADLTDRRRLLLFTQSAMLVAAGALGVLTLLGNMSPSLLLGFTFLLGVGAALNGPAWQAINSELVSVELLPRAMAANSASFNLARAAGPALGGIVVAKLGGGAAFLLNAVSFLAVVWVLFEWRRVSEEKLLPTERLFAAMRAGLRYVRYSPPVQTVLWWTIAFVGAASALWALLPLVAKEAMGRGSIGFGLLLGLLGSGAVVGAVLFNFVNRRSTPDQQVLYASIAFALAMAAPFFTRRFLLIGPAMFLAGFAWTSVLTRLNSGIQQVVPNWVLARALAVYMLLLQGGLAAGSFVWGAVAEAFGTRSAMAAAAVVMLASTLAVRRQSLSVAEGVDTTPLVHWADPVQAWEPHQEEGPVLVEVEYKIDPQHAERFVAVMDAVKTTRRRDGAVWWGLFHDVAEPGRYIETFVVESWVEHLRQHQRGTVADSALYDLVRSYHLGDEPPRVTHLIQARPDQIGARPDASTSRRNESES